MLQALIFFSSFNNGGPTPHGVPLADTKPINSTNIVFRYKYTINLNEVCVSMWRSYEIYQVCVKLPLRRTHGPKNQFLPVNF